MQRRTFCASAAAALGIAAWPFPRAYAAVSTIADDADDVEAVTGDGRQVLLHAADVEDFRAGLRGALLKQGATGYDDARRIYNGMFDRRPALIARCAGAADVLRSVQFARAHGLLVAVRGGGHSLSGQSVCDGGLMIDLSPMRFVRVDPGRRLAYVGGGALLGDIDRETLPFGLVTTTGTVSHTGAGGLTLGGGFGRVARRYGLTCDQLTSVDVVTADGRLVEASSEQNADLFWGLRGGGGNFGIATSFAYRLHPWDGWAVGGRLVFPLEQARDVLRGFDELYERAADGLWIEPVLSTAPGGARILMLDICYCDAPEGAEAALAPYRRLGRPVGDTVARVPYVQLQTQDDERARIGGRYYTKSGFVSRLDDDLIDAMLETIASAPVPMARIAMPPKGGAIEGVARDATAFWHRKSLYSVLLGTSNDDPADDAANVGWARSQWPTLEAFTEGFYANTNLSEIAGDRVRDAYGGNYDRLLALKRTYDPDNLFRLNANVDPRA
ncbi:MAG TPA: FAD-binding oxidoreductase [Woeseiaceae bacterium]|nr:FAD-binding oxidoreductase [Woeseiaceae bacterium]